MTMIMTILTPTKKTMMPIPFRGERQSAGTENEKNDGLRLTNQALVYPPRGE